MLEQSLCLWMAHTYLALIPTVSRTWMITSRRNKVRGSPTIKSSINSGTFGFLQNADMNISLNEQH